MAKKRIMILGAGLAGLSAAWHLRKRGIESHVFEAEKEVGGLCRSKRIDGFTFDYDGHVLHFKHRSTLHFIKELLQDNLAEHTRNAHIYSFGQFSRYPFQANLYGLPAAVVKECLLEFILTMRNGKQVKKDGTNFLQWIHRVFGSGIARHFMVPYNTKFWTVSPRELNCDWLDGFIPVPSLSQVLEGTVEESKRQFGYNAHFWYPKKGAINQLPLALAGAMKKNICTRCRVSEIDLAKKKIRFCSGAQERYDVLISTIPLPDMPYVIKELPKATGALFKKLRWNSIFNVNIGIEKSDSHERHWVYFPQEELSFFRVGFFHNLSSCLAPPNTTSLYAEVSYSHERPLDKKGIVARVKNDLAKVGILAAQDKICVQDTNDITYGYPLYDKNYHAVRGPIMNYLLQNHIIPAGRYGSWRYLSMEDVIAEGKIVADACAV